MFPPSTPSPPWLGRVERVGASSCPAYLVTPTLALTPAPCLLTAPTAPLTLSLGGTSTPVTSLVLHPAREGWDLALVAGATALPAAPACLNPITSKYSRILLSDTSLPPAHLRYPPPQSLPLHLPPPSSSLLIPPLPSSSLLPPHPPTPPGQ